MDAAAGSWTGVRAAGVAPAQRSTTAARWAGVVPQHPPTADTPNSVTKRCRCSARSSGVRS